MQNIVVNSGLYYKNIMIVNYASRVISEWRNIWEHYLLSSIMLSESSITFLESSIMRIELSIVLLELSITLFENIYSTGVTHDDDHHITIIKCL